MKSLLVITAVVEVGAGAALVAAPSAVAGLLVGGPLDGPAAVAVARVAGAALLAFAVACWSARDGGGDGGAGRAAARGAVAAALLYDCGAVAVLVHAGAAGGMRGAGLWPTVALHAALAAWCVACLAPRRGARPSPPAPA